MNRQRNFCKTAVVAFVWAILTTPLVTLPLLQFADSPRCPLSGLVNTAPYASRAAFVAVILIGLPLVATLLASIALRRVTSSWTPMAGGRFARSALTLGIFSTIAATAIFLTGILFGDAY